MADPSGRTQAPAPGPEEPPEALVSAIAWAKLRDDDKLAAVMEGLWEEHLAGSGPARTAIKLLVVGWEAGREWQAEAQRGARSE